MTPLKLYQIFKKKESLYKNKNMGVPQNLNKLSVKNFKKLQKISDYFNTIWQNIDPELYIKLGFEKWKSFNLDKLDNPDLFQKYKSVDKLWKMGYNKIDEDVLKKSISYIKNQKNYFNDEIIKQPIKDYIKNKIDPIFLCYLIEQKYIILTGEEKSLLSYFLNDYDEIKFMMYKKYHYIKEKFEMSENKEKPYMDDPKKKKKKEGDTQTENLIYGNDDPIDEKRKKKEDYKENKLNE